MRNVLMFLAALTTTLLLAPASIAQEKTAKRPWTLMIYGAADNNADGPILSFLDRIRKTWDDDPGMELILFIDRSRRFSSDAKALGSDFTGARIFRLRRHSAELLDASSHFPELKPGEDCELDSADVNNLGRFIAFCKDSYPARRYGLMIYSHANGAVMCPDDQSGRHMGIPELTHKVGAEASVDFLGLELCHMAGIEIAYQWRPGNGGFSTKILVAIPNAGIPLDWDRAFARIRSEGHATTAKGKVLDPQTMTAADFGRLVVREGYAGRRAHLERFMRAGVIDLKNPRHLERLREAGGCYDMSKCENVKLAIDRLAVALADKASKAVLEELRGSSDDKRMMNYAKRGRFDSRPYVDLYELLDMVGKSEKLSARVRSTARLARDAVDELVVDSFGVELAFDGFKAGKNGIFIVFPDGDATVNSRDGGQVRAWSKLRWYTPLADVDKDPSKGRWSFLQDGATAGNGKVENWFELLDFWFDDTEKSSAGLNRYRW